MLGVHILLLERFYVDIYNQNKDGQLFFIDLKGLHDGQLTNIFKISQSVKAM